MTLYLSHLIFNGPGFPEQRSFLLSGSCVQM